ncbi:hypothetical protein A3Q56_06055, partial [Intoshia linei]
MGDKGKDSSYEKEAADKIENREFKMPNQFSPQDYVNIVTRSVNSSTFNNTNNNDTLNNNTTVSNNSTLDEYMDNAFDIGNSTDLYSINDLFNNSNINRNDSVNNSFDIEMSGSNDKSFRKIQKLARKWMDNLEKIYNITYNLVEKSLAAKDHLKLSTISLYQKFLTNVINQLSQLYNIYLQIGESITEATSNILLNEINENITCEPITKSGVNETCIEIINISHNNFYSMIKNENENVENHNCSYIQNATNNFTGNFNEMENSIITEIKCSFESIREIKHMFMGLKDANSTTFVLKTLVKLGMLVENSKSYIINSTNSISNLIMELQNINRPTQNNNNYVGLNNIQDLGESTRQNVENNYKILKKVSSNIFKLIQRFNDEESSKKILNKIVQFVTKYMENNKSYETEAVRVLIRYYLFNYKNCESEMEQLD